VNETAAAIAAEAAGGKNPAAVELGRLGAAKGGHAAAARMTPQQRSRRAQIAAAARWGNPAPSPDPVSPKVTLAGAQRELALVRHQIALLRRKEKALAKMIDGMAVIAEMDAAEAGAARVRAGKDGTG
jgi:hypothetical protein